MRLFFTSNIKIELLTFVSRLDSFLETTHKHVYGITNRLFSHVTAQHPLSLFIIL